MKFKCIRTFRLREFHPSYHLLYEWENTLSDYLKIPFLFENPFWLKEGSLFYVCERRIRRGFSFALSFFLSKRKLEFFFDMGGRTLINPYNRKNIVPVIIDFFVKKDDLPLFYHVYNRNPFVLITSAEVYHFLLRNNAPLKLYHFPLSLPDKYIVSADNQFHKRWDLVLIGRQNSVLNEYLEQYCEKYNSFTYVYGKNVDGRYLSYTNKGDFVEDVSSRECYINLLRQAKVSFYSTPGIDGGEVRTNGFNQITPRFLELIACRCHIMARFKENEDTDYFQITDFCQHVDSYEQFEYLMQSFLATEVLVSKYDHYLERHCTSARMSTLSEIEKEIIKL